MSPQAWVRFAMISTQTAKGQTLSAGPMSSVLNGRRLPLKLVLLLALAGASFPVIQSVRQPEPWLASVTLGLDGRTGENATQAFELALREISTTQMLGRAVDLLGLERDPEYSGSASTGLGVALEILTGEGSGPADARRRAVQHLQQNIAVQRKPGSPEAKLLVRASDEGKAMRIAEAIATVYASGSELTGSIPAVGSAAASDRLQKAEAALADFTAKAGADKLSEALVLQSRISGLDRHIAEITETAGTGEGGLAKASLKDVLEGRAAQNLSDPQLEAARQSFLNATLAADALAVSLGPKHPRLVAAQTEVDSARRTLGDLLSRVKSRLTRQEQDRAANLKALKASRDTLARQIEATGVDLARHAELAGEAADARKAYDASSQAAASGKDTIFEASVPQPLDKPEQTYPVLRIVLGALAGTALALTLAAWWHQKRAGKPEEPRKTAPIPSSPAVRAAGDRVEPAMTLPPVNIAALPAAKPSGEPLATPVRIAEEMVAPRPPVAAPQDEMLAKLSSIRERRRQHVVANIPDPADLPPRSKLGLERVAPEDLPLIDKLRQVAPHVFADPVEQAEIERLRLELAELRAKVLYRKVGAA